MEDVIYFELNNWFAGRDYPATEPFLTWMNDYVLKFRDEEWVKENKLCVVAGNVDMSSNYCITTTKDWVENNCPDLLTLYTEFIRTPYEDGEVEGRFGAPFKEYNEENIGVHYWDYDNDCWEDLY